MPSPCLMTMDGFGRTLRMRTEAVGFVGEDLHIDFGDHRGNGRTFIGWDVVPARVEVDSRNGKEVFVGLPPRRMLANTWRGLRSIGSNLFTTIRTTAFTGLGN